VGSNIIPTNSNYGVNTTVTPWLVLTITSNPKIIDNNGNAQVMANLLYDSNGVYHDPAYGHVPDGITVNFTSKDGNLNPTSITMINGQAESVFTVINAGSANIKATANNLSVSTSLTINPTTTTKNIQLN